MNKDLRAALIVGGVAAAILILVPAIGMGFWGARFGGFGMMSGFGWGIGAVFMVVFWGLVIWAIVALVRGLGGPGAAAAGGTDSALEVLKKRYARGEITKAEFEEMKRDLS